MTYAFFSTGDSPWSGTSTDSLDSLTLAFQGHSNSTAGLPIATLLLVSNGNISPHSTTLEGMAWTLIFKSTKGQSDDGRHLTPHI